MPNRSGQLLFRAGSALAFALVLAACTPGGQFDPTTIFDNDMFSTKTALKGQRVPLFPNGVPGATTGVPADLVKGYKPPADAADADPDAINPPPGQLAQQGPAPESRPEAKPESKPKPKVAIGRPHGVLKPPKSNPTRIDVGAKGTPPQQTAPANWPAPPPTGAASQDVAWPAPPPTAPPPSQAAQQSQGIWPAPPPTAPVQPAAAPARAPAPAPASQPASQNAPSFDSMWPKPTAGAPSQ
jgi:hypothetical protein